MWNLIGKCGRRDAPYSHGKWLHYPRKLSGTVWFFCTKTAQSAKARSRRTLLFPSDTQDALGRPDAGVEDGLRSIEADRMGDVIEADLFRQRGQLSRLLAEAMAKWFESLGLLPSFY